jgi:hypothetical protein
MFLKNIFSVFCNSSVMYIAKKIACAKFKFYVVTKLLFVLVFRTCKNYAVSAYEFGYVHMCSSIYFNIIKYHDTNIKNIDSNKYLI